MPRPFALVLPELKGQDDGNGVRVGPWPMCPWLISPFKTAKANHFSTGHMCCHEGGRVEGGVGRAFWVNTEEEVVSTALSSTMRGKSKSYFSTVGAGGASRLNETTISSRWWLKLVYENEWGLLGLFQTVCVGTPVIDHGPRRTGSEITGAKYF